MVGAIKGKTRLMGLAGAGRRCGASGAQRSDWTEREFDFVPGNHHFAQARWGAQPQRNIDCLSASQERHGRNNAAQQSRNNQKP